MMKSQVTTILRYGLIGNVFFVLIVVPVAQIIGIDLKLSSNFLPEIAASAFIGIIFYCLALSSFIGAFLDCLLLIRSKTKLVLIWIITIITFGFIKVNVLRNKIEKIRQIINSIQQKSSNLTLPFSSDEEMRNDLCVPFGVFLKLWRLHLPPPLRQKLFNINSFFVFSINMVTIMLMYLTLIIGIWMFKGRPTKIPLEIVPYRVYLTNISGEYCALVAIFLLFLFCAVAGSTYSLRWDTIVFLFLKKQGQDAIRLTFETIRQGESAIRNFRDFVE